MNGKQDVNDVENLKIEVQTPSETQYKDGEQFPVSPKLKTTYIVSWRNVSYTVIDKTTKNKKVILNNISGRVAPGEVMAIMGPSGSGKTTFLDILADRINTGVIDGDMLLNGAPRDVDAFRMVASYVAQEDSLLGSFTTVETLRYAAAIALPPSVSKEEKEERVQLAILEMGLKVCENTRVGDIFFKGLSGGQKRRLSIAIELLSKPSILILDEPTSGLDASSTFNVMKYIGHLAKAGRSIICTIHQPSSKVFNLFNTALFLVSGQPVAYGSPTSILDEFAELGYPCPQYENPADYYLSLINTDFEGHADVDFFVKSFRGGKILASLITLLDGDKALPSVGHPKHLYPSMINQFFVLMHRNFLNNLRNPGIFWVRIAMYFILSLMIGTMYLYTNEDISDADYVPLLFYVQAFLVFMSVAVLPFFIEQRSVFTRERSNSSLSVTSYVLANFFSALPGICFIALISSIMVVFLADLNGFGYFFLNLFLSLVAAESLMHVIGAAVPQYIIGIALGAGIFGMFMLCEGFMIPRESMKGYWIWAYYIAMHTYSFESFVYEQFKNEAVGTPGYKILERLGMLDTDTPRNMGILTVYSIGLQMIFAFILYKYHTGRR